MFFFQDQLCNYRLYVLWKFIFLLLCWVGIHCSIYKGSYSVSNMSYLNCFPLPPILWFPEQFQKIIISAIIYMCTHDLHHIHPPTPFPRNLPLPPVPSSPLPPEPILPTVLWFCRRKNIKKRNMARLLVWDKDSHTGSCLVLFPCIYVLQPQLVHLYQSSSNLVLFPW
jgi:hypothetical protein